jgi:hypothetical protein
VVVGGWWYLDTKERKEILSDLLGSRCGGSGVEVTSGRKSSPKNDYNVCVVKVGCGLSCVAWLRGGVWRN